MDRVQISLPHSSICSFHKPGRVGHIFISLALAVVLSGLIATPGLAKEDIQDTGTILTAGQAREFSVPKFLREIATFDKLYWQRQQGKNITAQQWLDMAKLFNRYREQAIPLDRKSNGQFLLRGLLIEGECLLFASVELFQQKPNSPEFFKVYEEGIRTLDMVIDIATKDIDYLPRYSLVFSTDPRNDERVIAGPQAGYETIGTGVMPGPAYLETDVVPRRRVGHERTAYVDLESFRSYAERFLNDARAQLRGRYFMKMDDKEEPTETFRQIYTSEAARELLTDFCPWGVELFLFLKNEAKLAQGINMGILRPFRTEENLETWDSTFLRNIPINVHKQMTEILGFVPPDYDTAKAEGKRSIEWVKKSTGKAVINGIPQKLEWYLVQERPHYLIRFVSPIGYDMRPSGMFAWALRGVGLCTGAQGMVAGEFASYTIDKVGNIFGKKSDIYTYSYAWKEAGSWGVDKDLFIKRNMDYTKVVSQAAGYGFKFIENWEDQMNFEGIAPTQFRMGTSYNGKAAVPPIVFRADVFGYEYARDTEYPRTLRLQCFWLLNPSALAYKTPDITYDLSGKPVRELERKDDYLAAKELVQRRAWHLLPNAPTLPLGIRGTTTDFSPKSQIFDFEIDVEAFRQWQKTPLPIKVVLHPPGDPKQKIIERDLSEPRIILQLANRLVFREAWVRMQKPGGFFVRSWHVYPGARDRDIPARIFSEYDLVVKQGDNILKEMRVNFYERPERKATGEIISWKPAYVLLKQRVTPKEPETAVRPEPKKEPDKVQSFGDECCPPPEGADQRITDTEKYYLFKGQTVGTYRSWYGKEKTKPKLKCCYDAEGKRRCTYKAYYEDGKPKKEGKYAEGKEHGVFLEYHRNGQVHYRTTYVSGVKNGAYEKFDDDGKPHDDQGTYKDGRRDGLWKTYYHGVLRSTTNYKDGKREGMEIYYRDDGQIYQQYEYEDDREVKWLDKNGKVLRIKKYVQEGDSIRIIEEHPE